MPLGVWSAGDPQPDVFGPTIVRTVNSTSTLRIGTESRIMRQPSCGKLLQEGVGMKLRERIGERVCLSRSCSVPEHVHGVHQPTKVLPQS